MRAGHAPRICQKMFRLPLAGTPERAHMLPAQGTPWTPYFFTSPSLSPVITLGQA